MDGPDAYEALIRATSELSSGSSFSISLCDVIDLQKLKVSELEERGVARKTAERISSDLLQGRLDELGKHLGLKLTKKRDVSRLGSEVDEPLVEDAQ